MARDAGRARSRIAWDAGPVWWQQRVVGGRLPGVAQARSRLALHPLVTVCLNREVKSLSYQRMSY